YGEEVYDLFRAVKNIFDPHDILNPGIKLTSEPFTSHIDVERVSGNCSSCGKCNAVCPVYGIRQEESNGPRGWLQIVTATGFSHDADGRAAEACVNCKSCIPACPVGIDIPAQILAKRTQRPNALAGRIFKLQSRTRLFESLLKWAGRLQPYWDRPLPRRMLDALSRPFLKALGSGARLAPSLFIPRIATRSLRERFAELTEEQGARGEAAYFHGCAANYLDDGVGPSVIDLLTKTGTRVVLPAQRCSGTPVETYGHKALVLENAQFNIRSLSRYKTVITGCASCTYMLRDYSRLFPDEKDRAGARDLGEKVVHITEYLEKNGIKLPHSAATPGQRVTYHSSCHLKAAGVGREPRDLIKRIPGVEFVEMKDADRCAGGAGTYIVRDFESSEAIFQRKREGILESKAGIVATSCPACMIRLKTGLNPKIRVQHIAQLLNDAMGPKPS
ncbi:MAG TPA: heterodisulfide reductase-related iron-sulfur binding cluster, partial [Nitrospiria bacterium]